MQDSTPRILTPEWLLGILPVPPGYVVSKLFPAEGLGVRVFSSSVERDICYWNGSLFKVKRGGGIVYSTNSIITKLARSKSTPHPIYSLRLSGLPIRIDKYIWYKTKQNSYSFSARIKSFLCYNSLHNYCFNGYVMVHRGEEPLFTLPESSLGSVDSWKFTHLANMS